MKYFSVQKVDTLVPTWCVDIEVETVLLAPDEPGLEEVQLGTNDPGTAGDIQHSTPGLGRLGSLQSQTLHWGRGVRNAWNVRYQETSERERGRKLSLVGEESFPRVCGLF